MDVEIRNLDYARPVSIASRTGRIDGAPATLGQDRDGHTGFYEQQPPLTNDEFVSSSRGRGARIIPPETCAN